MPLPNFIAIGAQRCGTTWLTANLRTHPQVFIPPARKEVHFFDQHYERGIGWYESYFPDNSIKSSHRAIGEITPRYIFDSSVPSRIADHLPSVRLLAILRNPVDRAYSHYGLRVRDQGIQTDFRSFIEMNIENNDDVFERGKYSQQLRRYLEYFEEDQIHIVIFERFVNNPEQVRSEVADFLGISPHQFSEPEEKQNASYIPRFPRLRASVRRIADFLRWYGGDWIVEQAKAAGIPHMFGNAGSLPPMEPDDRRYLADHYEQEIRELESLLSVDLGQWWSVDPERPGSNRSDVES